MILYIKANDGRYINVVDPLEIVGFLKEFGAVGEREEGFFFDVYRFFIRDDDDENKFRDLAIIENFVRANIDDVYHRYGDIEYFIVNVLIDYACDFDVYKRTQFGNILASIIDRDVPQDVEIGAYEFCKKYYPDIVK